MKETDFEATPPASVAIVTSTVCAPSARFVTLNQADQPVWFQSFSTGSPPSRA